MSTSTFSGNTTAGSAGAIAKNGGASLTVSNSTFTDNHAGSGADGGAILDFSSGASSVSNSTLSGNTAGGNGGAIAKEGGVSLTVSNSSFPNNHAGSGSDGGAILDFSDDTLSVSNGTFSGNTAGGNGGAIATGARVFVTGTNFTQNSAGSLGGALVVFSAGTGRVTNSCFSRDTAPTGGGIAKCCGATLNAENNWWGAPNGPSGVGLGSGDAVTARVDFTPFLTTPPSFCAQQPVPTAVPTLSQWAQLGMIALLLAGGLTALRRNRARPA